MFIDSPLKDITNMKEAEYYSKIGDGNVKCNLCPHNCILANNESGKCKVRQNVEGILYSKSYMKISSLSLDPIEKKPLFHFLPGKRILSVGSVGCNLECEFCQNFEISQCNPDDYRYLKETSVSNIIIHALRNKENCGIAFTYNEPIVEIEFVKELAQAAKKENLRTVFISNGYINLEPLKDLMQYIDAFNIDLKAFDNSFYKTYTGGDLDTVLRTLKIISASKKHLEITNLIIPTLNDDEDSFRNLLKWIKVELGKNTPLHLSGYFPRYKMKIEATPIHILDSFYQIAKEYLNYVYIGNVYSFPGSNTSCPSCKKTVIERIRYTTKVLGLDGRGNCEYCDESIITPEFYAI